MGCLLRFGKHEIPGLIGDCWICQLKPSHSFGKKRKKSTWEHMHLHVSLPAVIKALTELSEP